MSSNNSTAVVVRINCSTRGGTTILSGRIRTRSRVRLGTVLGGILTRSTAH